MRRNSRFDASVNLIHCRWRNKIILENAKTVEIQWKDKKREEFKSFRVMVESIEENSYMEFNVFRLKERITIDGTSAFDWKDGTTFCQVFKRIDCNSILHLKRKFFFFLRIKNISFNSIFFSPIKLLSNPFHNWKKSAQTLEGKMWTQKTCISAHIFFTYLNG